MVRVPVRLVPLITRHQYTHLLQVLPIRLARSKALQDVNRLKIAIRDTEDSLQAIAKSKGMDEEKEVGTSDEKGS